MKQCPVCKNTYTDESLIFCLSDGTRLTSFYEAEKTQALPRDINSTEAHHRRVSIPIDAPTMETKIVSPTITASQTEKKGCSPFMIAAILGLFGILAVAGIVIAYFAFKDKLIAQNETPTPTPTISQTNSNSNSKEQELKDKLDKLQKQLDEQKKAANKTPVPVPTAPITPPSSTTTATVNAPSDGFLAMRSEPNHKTGYQIMKIPHGATVNVFNCQGSTSIAGKTGRWCQVNYAGNSGWAFDAWLVY